MAMHRLPALIVCLSTLTCSGEEADRGRAALQELSNRLDARLPPLLEEHKAAAVAVAIIDDGRITLTRVHGLQGPGVPASTESLFNVASMTKPVTAEVILRLVAEGHISLDESMAPHWIDPDLADDPRHELLTPRIALSHQTGFLIWRRMHDGGKLGFTFDPGTGFGYSGEGYNYVARFAENKLGRNFESLAEEYVFQPIGLESTTFSARDWMEGRTVIPMDNTGQWEEPDLQPEGIWDAADDLFVTVADYARFMISVMKGEGLSEELARERLRLHVSQEDDPAIRCSVTPASLCPVTYGYALGWMRWEYEGGLTMIHHGGNDWGESGWAYFYPETGDGVVVLTNGGNGFRVLFDALDLIDDKQLLTAWFRSLLGATGSVRVITSVTGSGSDPDGFTFTVGAWRPVSIGVNDTVTLGPQNPGEAAVRLQDIAANCVVTSENPQTVVVSSDQVAEVTFDLSCSL